MILYTGIGTAVKHLYSPMFREVRGTFRVDKLNPLLLFKAEIQSTTVNGMAKYGNFVHPILLFDDFMG